MPLDHISDDGIVSELGRRISMHRAARNLTQDEFAKRAGVARSTVQRIEGGTSIQMSSFVKMLRTLDRLDALDALLDPEIRSPVAELQRQRERRQRVRHRRSDGGDEVTAADSVPWTWDDDESPGR